MFVPGKFSQNRLNFASNARGVSEYLFQLALDLKNNILDKLGANALAYCSPPFVMYSWNFNIIMTIKGHVIELFSAIIYKCS